MLDMKEFACSNPDKKEGLCENCLRNIDLQEASFYEKWEDFKLKKSFKTTPMSYVCDGFLGKDR